MALLALASPLAPSAGPAGDPHRPAAPEFEIRDWVAVGSGCQARRSAPGGVQVSIGERLGGGRYQVRVDLPSYGLEGDRPAAPGAADFARECAIRIAVHPAAGKKIRSVAAGAAFGVKKDPAAKVRLRSRLLVGDATLDRREDWIAAGESEAQHDVSLQGAPDRREAFFRQLACEKPKVVGLDLSAAVFRESTRPAVSVVLAGHHASLTLEIEDCPRPSNPDAGSP